MSTAKRGRVYHLRRRVLRRYRSIEPRETVWISLHTDSETVAALLGTVPEPRFTVSKALELYWGLAKEKALGKSEDQLRRWEAPRKKAVKNFVAVVGKKEIANITRDDMRDFRQHWLDRIEAREVTAA